MRSAVSLSDRCHGRWHGILTALGIEAIVLNKKNQPCPMCGGKDRYRWTNHNDLGGYYCSGCGAGDGIKFVQEIFSLDFKGAAEKIETVIGGIDLDTTPKRSADQNLNAMRSVWRAGHTIHAGDPVGLYLAGRKLHMPAYPACLKYVPQLRHEGGAAPGMIAQVVSPEGRAVNIHRTWLKPDGSDKADLEPNRKIMKGTIPDGSAIRLARAGDLLGIAEGIETAIAASLRFNLPVWAVISEGGMQRFRPPPAVKHLIIFGDNDLNFVGQAAANVAGRDIGRAAQREKRTIDVEVRIPEKPGSDWADDMPELHQAAA